MGIPEHFEYEQSRPHNLKALSSCEAVYVQSNWSYSEGAKDEIANAKAQGKEIYYADDNGFEILEEQSRFLFEREVDS